jgi:hypothetical protein
MLQRLIFMFTFVLLFGLGQQGAIIHELSHLNDLPLSQQHDKTSHSPVCSKCLSYGELANAVTVGQFILPVMDAGHELIQYIALIHYTLPSAAYSARAPPPVLV